MVRIAGFHPADPGSSPGVGTLFFILNLIWVKQLLIMEHELEGLDIPTG